MISAENIENLEQGKDHPENALLAAREIVKWLDAELELRGLELDWMLDDYLPDWNVDGLILSLESIIAHQYSEEARDESIPFSDD